MNDELKPANELNDKYIAWHDFVMGIYKKSEGYDEKYEKVFEAIIQDMFEKHIDKFNALT